MIAAPAALHQYTIATLPLRCEYLRQASLFEERDYPLPTVLPGQEVVIYDAENWQDNFKRGRVIAYSYFTGLHTILFDSVSEGDFKGWEIMKALGS